MDPRFRGDDDRKRRDKGGARRNKNGTERNNFYVTPFPRHSRESGKLYLQSANISLKKYFYVKSDGIFRRIPKKEKECTKRYITELDEQSNNEIPSAVVKISHEQSKYKAENDIPASFSQKRESVCHNSRKY